MSPTVQVEGARLHYEQRGSGTPLVLLHGGYASGAVWEPFAAALDGFQSILVDSRGHGRSTGLDGSISYTQLAHDTAALIAQLGFGKPIVCGWSDGGQVALELAVRHPGVAGALVVGGAYPDFVGSGLREAHRDLAEHLPEHLGDQIDEIISLHAGGRQQWDQLVERTAEMWLSYEGLTLEQISAFDVPALVIAGDRDELVGLDLSLRLYQVFSNAELAVCPRADHSAPMTVERAPTFAALVADFATRVRTGDQSH